MERMLCLLALALGPFTTSRTCGQESEGEPYPIDREIWGGGEIAGPVPKHAPPEPPAPIAVTEWLWLVGEVSPLTVFERYVAVGMAPPREEAELENARWTKTPPPEGALWAHASIESAAGEVRMARLTGAEVLFVNGEGFWGDPRRYGFCGVPVALGDGKNELFVTGIDGQFELELWSPATRCVIGTWDVAWPLTVDWTEEESIDEIEFPVFNASTKEVPGLHLHYGHVAPDDGVIRPDPGEWSDGDFLPPLGMLWAGTYFWDWSETDKVLARSAAVPICVFADGDLDADRKLLRGPFLGTPREERHRPHPERNPAALGGSLLGRYTANTRVLIYGTVGTDAENRRSLARARFDQQLVGYVSGCAPLLVSDHAFLQDEERYQDKGPVLYGNEDTNAAWNEILREQLEIRIRRSAIEIPTREVRSTDVGGWIDLGRVAAVFDTGEKGAAVGYFARWVVNPLPFGNYAVYELDPFWNLRPMEKGWVAPNERPR